MFEDLKLLQEFDEGKEVWDRIDNSITNLFTTASEAFVALDLHVLREKYWTVHVAPPNYFEVVTEYTADDIDADPIKPWICKQLCSDGHVCVKIDTVLKNLKSLKIQKTHE